MSNRGGEDAREIAKPVDPPAPIGLASQVIADIVEQAPMYGLSGAIFAAGLVTGRRALARTGARMFVGQLLSAVTSASLDRVLPEPRTGGDGALHVKTDSEPSPVAETPVPEKTPVEARRPGTTTVTTGAMAGLAAVAAGGWLVRRLLAKKPSAEKAD